MNRLKECLQSLTGRWGIWLLAGVAVLLVVAGLASPHMGRHPANASVQTNTLLAPVTEDPEQLPSLQYAPTGHATWDRIQGYLKEAEEACIKAGEKADNRLKDFFALRTNRARAFTQKIVPTIRITTPQVFRQRFESSVFSQHDLEGNLRGIITVFVQDLQRIEAGLLARVQADLAEKSESFRTEEAFRKAYLQAADEVLAVATKNYDAQLVQNVVAGKTQEVVVFVSMSVAKGVGEHLGMKLQPGSPSLSTASSMLVDEFLDWLVRSLNCAPGKDVKERTDQALYDFEDLVVLGEMEYEPEALSGAKARMLHVPAGKYSKQEMQTRWKLSKTKSRGLIGELAQVHGIRTDLRRAALEKLVLKGGQ
jgi:hypothetical protein